uniref:NADH-ubiquinone oxidoreductase chain 6 n=1 Tax=Scarabaeidae sp. BMNH 1274752 TaxID=1796540 RepID=A0A126TGI9_9SCAR|nr:NADH dehydrogenase subunit 6 [Scarabaeidae sp. BMNH 1274752]
MLILFMMMLSLTLSSLFIFLKHPMSLGTMLLMQTILLSLLMGFFNMNYWYSYILFLIMIGGMLILFIYMTSIASNELFYPSIKLLTIPLTIFSIFSMLLNLDYYYLWLNNLMENMNNNKIFLFSINKYFNFPNNLISYMLIIYLLITLFSIVKVTNFKKGALRQMN